MLKKQIKYDLKKILKVLVIFYSLSLFFSVLTRIFLNIDNSFIINIIGSITSGITISMIFNILINNLMGLFSRFRNNFYGDESYLTHTLPISKKTLYLSKILSSIITLFTSILVISITLFVAYYSKENIEILKNILLPLANIYNTEVIIIILAFLFIFFLEFFTLIESGYTGIILGHKKNNSKIGYSVLFGFITYILVQIVILFIMFIIALFSKDLMNLFITNEIISVDIVKTIIYMAIFIYSIMGLILYFINLKLFKSGVNVD